MSRTPGFLRPPVSVKMGPAFLHNLRRQYFNRKCSPLLHGDSRLCLLPEVGKLCCRRGCHAGIAPGILQKKIPILTHNRLLTDIKWALQMLMEMTVPPLTVLHASYRLFSAELRPNTCRRAAGRTISYLGLLQDSDAEAALRQSHGNQRSG